MKNDLTSDEMAEIEAFANEAETELRQELGDGYDAHMEAAAERVLRNVRARLAMAQLLADLEIEEE
jgi:hypothetical protein